MNAWVYLLIPLLCVSPLVALIIGACKLGKQNNANMTTGLANLKKDE